MYAWQHVWLPAQPCRLAGVSAPRKGGSLLGKEALCQGSRRAGAAAAGETMYDHHVDLWSAAMPKQTLGFILSVVRAVSKPAAYGKVQGLAESSAQCPTSRWGAAGSLRAEGPGSISISVWSTLQEQPSWALAIPSHPYRLSSLSSRTLPPPVGHLALHVVLPCLGRGGSSLLFRVSQVFSSTGWAKALLIKQQCRWLWRSPVFTALQKPLRPKIKRE